MKQQNFHPECNMTYILFPIISFVGSVRKPILQFQNTFYSRLETKQHLPFNPLRPKSFQATFKISYCKCIVYVFININLPIRLHSNTFYVNKYDTNNQIMSIYKTYI